MFTSRAAATITAGKKGALVVSLRRGWFHPLGVCNANNKKKKKLEQSDKMIYEIDARV